MIASEQLEEEKKNFIIKDISQPHETMIASEHTKHHTSVTFIANTH